MTQHDALIATVAAERPTRPTLSDSAESRFFESCVAAQALSEEEPALQRFNRHVATPNRYVLIHSDGCAEYWRDSDAVVVVLARIVELIRTQIAPHVALTFEEAVASGRLSDSSGEVVLLEVQGPYLFAQKLVRSFCPKMHLRATHFDTDDFWIRR